MAPRPLLAASLAFVAGVALGAWLPQEPSAWGWAVAVLLAAWAVLGAAGCVAAGKLACLAVFVVAGIFRCQGDLSPLYAGADPVLEGDAVANGVVARPAQVQDGDVLLHLEAVRLRRGEETVALELPLQVLISGGLRPAQGEIITARGTLRAIRGDRNLGWFPAPAAPRGRRYAARLVVASAVWVRSEGRREARGPAAAVLRWRAAADSFWKQRPGPAAQILNALTTGERAGIPRQMQESFLRSGLTHLLAISGMNVGFLAALVFLALRRALALCEPLALRSPVQPLAAALTLPSLWFFMLFSGSQIPVGRAVICCGTGLAALVLWRRIAPGPALGIAALAILAADPRSLFTPSFQLSFAAVAGLLLVAPRLCPRTPEGAGGWATRLRRGTLSLLVVSTAATLATAPLVAFHFQQVSLVGPIANLVAVPFTGFLVLPAGWLTLGVAALFPPAGELAAGIAIGLADGLIAVASWFAGAPGAVLSCARPPLLLTLCLLALACAALAPPSRRVQRAGVAACAAAAVAAGAWSIAVRAPGLLVAFLDVGQGLACAVVLPGGGSLLFDAGPKWDGYDAGERVVVPALRKLGVWRLGTLVISHRHPDHEGGSEAVRRGLGAGRTLRAEGEGALARGQERDLGGGVRLRVLNPATPSQAGAPGDANDRSLALLLSYGETGFAFTADAGPAMLPAIAVAATPRPRHLALQVPHHGGSEASAAVCADALAPEVSVISVGRNSFGHPRAGAVKALEGAGRVLRTDRDGGVFLRSGGRALAVRTWRELSLERTWAERARWLVAGW